MAKVITISSWRANDIIKYKMHKMNLSLKKLSEDSGINYTQLSGTLNSTSELYDGTRVKALIHLGFSARITKKIEVEE
jgi:lambda repressor-like predicted transcriptional regulator